jgi:hypothetical protein
MKRNYIAEPPSFLFSFHQLRHFPGKSKTKLLHQKGVMKLTKSASTNQVAVNQISINSSYIARILGAVALLLVLANIAGQLTVYLVAHAGVYGFVRLLDIDAENNIPSGFSALLLLIAALLLAIITLLNRKQTGSIVSYWAVLSSGFFFMAADEAWSFHERLIKPVRKLLDFDNFGIFYNAWVIPGITLVFVLALFFLKFMLRLPAKTRIAFLVAATLYLSGAIGIELIGGSYDELHGNLNLTYSMIVTVEESLEMAGVIIFIRALLVYIADNYKELRFRFGKNT